MQQRRPSSTLRQCDWSMLLALLWLCGWCHITCAQSPTASPAPVLSTPIPAERASNGHRRQRPINSTLEIRVARRPWLIEKLLKPSPKPSVKMNPPRPPADLPDPPSASQVLPNYASQGGWVRRGDTLTPDSDDAADQPGNMVATDAANDAVDQEKPTDSTRDQAVGSNTLLQDGDQGSMTNDQRTSLGSTEEIDAEESVEGTDSLSEKKQSDSETTQKEPIRQPPQEASEAGSPDSAAESETALDGEPAAQSTPEQESDTAESPAAEDERENSTDSQPDAVPATRPPSSDAPEDKATKGTRSTADDPPPSKLEAVRIRELHIDSDGKRIEKPGPSDRADETSRSTASSSTEIPPSQLATDKPAVQLDYTGYPKSPLRLTRTVQYMQNSMRNCLRYYFSRTEVANERSNWGMLHSIMVYGADTRILVGNKSYSAVAWIAGNNACRGKKLLTDEDGHIAVRSGIGLQGHQAQMLCVFSLCDVPADYPLFAGNNRYTVQDLLETEMLACESGQELTFTLISLAHYLDTDAVWTSADGQTWDFERLIREELAQPIVGAACGGTHRLMGFAHALRKRRAEGRPITGQWKRAEVYIRNFVGYAYRIQNRDGSMSTDWFEGREDNGEIDRKIQTTGHIVEWLLTVTPDSRLQDSRLVSAIRFLLASMYNERDHDWRIGPKGHALRSLAMYYERVYQSGPAWQSRTIAKSRRTSRH